MNNYLIFAACFVGWIIMGGITYCIYDRLDYWWSDNTGYILPCLLVWPLILLAILAVVVLWATYSGLEWVWNKVSSTKITKLILVTLSYLSYLSPWNWGVWIVDGIAAVIRKVSDYYVNRRT